MSTPTKPERVEVGPIANVLLCDHCGELPATCRGQYEAMTEPANACDECCGHGCEDGHCDELGQAEAVREVVTP